MGEPYYSNKEKGTGLGLMICFKIIQEHSGELLFKSKEGNGTTVKINLPVMKKYINVDEIDKNDVLLHRFEL